MQVLKTITKTLEVLLWVSGSLLLSIFAAHLALAEYHRIQGIESFNEQISIDPIDISVVAPIEAVEQVATARVQTPILEHDVSTADQTLWSAGRIRSFAASLVEKPGDILAVFSIPRLDLEVPVYDGASDLHMDLGVARIEGTAMPGRGSNMGIAGHRDGFFRVLKDIRFGDELIVKTASGNRIYTVQQTMIVEPTVVNVLDDTDQEAITLVTCYPFYFVGHAPERFIVRAVLNN